MAYPDREAGQTKLAERRPDDQQPARYRFELSGVRLVLCSLGLIVTLVWMFAFGILVGREIPLVKEKDISIQARFLRFMGLGKQPVPLPEDVASTWDTPEKMLESLKYHESLTEGPSSRAGAPPASEAKKAAPRQEPATPEKAVERYTLLICSLKNKDNAQRLVEQLKSKGYASRLETHEGKWSRVLVGSFDDREKAMKYVTDFNQKERMEALVIREP